MLLTEAGGEEGVLPVIYLNSLGDKESGNWDKGVVRTRKNSAVFCVVLIDDKLDKMFEHSDLSISFFSCLLLLGFKGTPRTAPLPLLSM